MSLFAVCKYEIMDLLVINSYSYPLSFLSTETFFLPIFLHYNPPVSITQNKISKGMHGYIAMKGRTYTWLNCE